MISGRRLWKGSASGGAFLLSGCSADFGPGTLLALAANPIGILVAALGSTVALLILWWIILRLSRKQPKRAFRAVIALHCLGIVLVIAPSLALSTQWVWPSLSLMAQAAAIGTGLACAVLFASAALCVWVTLAMLIDRI